jgi:Flp pilus assembly CpaF family ATPase
MWKTNNLSTYSIDNSSSSMWSYADLNVYRYETNVEELILTDASFIISRSSEDICSINHFLISEKYSDIINSILHEFHQKIDFQTNFYSFPISRLFQQDRFF